VLIPTSRRTASHIRLALVGISVTFAVMACSSVAAAPPSAPQAPPSSSATAPDAPLVRQLASRVSDARALKHLQALQKIADEHGGNRAAGTPGYDASVEYVVGVLRDIGFRASTPTFESSGGHGEGPSGPECNVITQTRTGDPSR
jgi:aminopeptidase S